MVYVNSRDWVNRRDNATYALDSSTGGLVWTFQTKDLLYSSPVVVNGVVYIGSNDNHVYAIGELPSNNIYYIVAAVVGIVIVILVVAVFVRRRH
jgi:glucose dehydrogenase